MQYSIRHLSAGRFALAIATAAVSLLFVLAASAKAESTNAVATAVDSVEAIPASAELATPPAETPTSATPATPIDVPEPAESFAAKSTSAPEAAVPDSLGSKVRQLNTTSASTERVARLAEEIRHDTAAAAAAIKYSAKTAAQVVDEAAPLGTDRVAPLGRVRDLVGHPLQSVSGVDVETPSYHAVSMLPNALPTGAYLRYRTTIMDDFLVHPLAEIGGVEPTRPGAPNATAIGDSSRAAAVALGEPRANSGERSVNLPTFDRNSPSPSPSLPDAVASGLGSSSFVPIVALLALLALVVPAILRRFREVPGFRAPLPIVCVLERPG